MNNIKCLNCKREFPLEKTYEDDKGVFTVCPYCKSLLDTDEEVELGDKHIERIDEIDNAVYEMCKVLAENENLKWDMEYIGEIADFAASMLVKSGNRVRYPAVVTEEDGRQYIVEYYGEEAKGSE